MSVAEESYRFNMQLAGTLRAGLWHCDVHRTTALYPVPPICRPAQRCKQALHAAADTPTPSEPSSSGGRSWFRDWLDGSKADREKLSKFGVGAFCAYGVISNINAAMKITVAWITVVKATGKLPFNPEVWPQFLTVYAGDPLPRGEASA